MKFTAGPMARKITQINRLMEMLDFAERAGKVAIVPVIEQAIRNILLEA